MRIVIEEEREEQRIENNRDEQSKRILSKNRLNREERREDLCNLGINLILIFNNFNYSKKETLNSNTNTHLNLLIQGEGEKYLHFVL